MNMTLIGTSSMGSENPVGKPVPYPAQDGKLPAPGCSWLTLKVDLVEEAAHTDLLLGSRCSMWVNRIGEALAHALVGSVLVSPLGTTKL